MTIDLDRSIAGMQPAGDAPWVRVVFDDDAGFDGVQMTISTPGLSGTEFLWGFFFNIEPFLVPTGTFVSGVEAFHFNFREDIYNANHGPFDARFRYADNEDAATPMFTGVDHKSVYNLVHSDLSVASLNALSANGELFVAARVQGFSDGVNNWITGTPTVVPLPPAALLLLTGLLGMGLLKRCRKAKPASPAV